MPATSFGARGAAAHNEAVPPAQSAKPQHEPGPTWWHVEGADDATGADRSIRVRADGPADAERQAREAGLLVASIKPDDATSTAAACPLDYHSGRADGVPALGPNPMIVRGYAALRTLAFVLRGVALVCLAGAAIVVAWPFITRQYQYMGLADWLPVAATALTPAAACVVLLALAEALRMLGAIGLAVDEIARKT
jgi:hypothetical protein